MMRTSLVSVSLIALSLMMPAQSLKTEKGMELRNDLLEQAKKGSLAAPSALGAERNVNYILQCGLLCVLLGAATWYLNGHRASDPEAKKPAAPALPKDEPAAKPAPVAKEPAAAAPAAPAQLVPEDEDDALALDDYLDLQRQREEFDESDDMLNRLLDVSQDSLDAEFQKECTPPQPQPKLALNDGLDETIEAQLDSEVRAKLDPQGCMAALDAYLDRQRQQDEAEESDEILAQLLQVSQDSIDAEFAAELALAPVPPPPQCTSGVQESIEAMLNSELEAQLHPSNWITEEQ